MPDRQRKRRRSAAAPAASPKVQAPPRRRTAPMLLREIAVAAHVAASTPDERLARAAQLAEMDSIDTGAEYTGVVLHAPEGAGYPLLREAAWVRWLVLSLATRPVPVPHLDSQA